MNIRRVINIRYASIREIDISNGSNIGVALFVQGCPFHCYNCFNPETWDFNGGKEWTQKIKEKFFELIDRPYIKRISFLGGECLCEENISAITEIVKECKKLFPDKEIWLWSGYKFKEYICDLDITNYIDYIIDGQFINELKDITLKFRGSSNQRIWHKVLMNDKYIWVDVTDNI